LAALALVVGAVQIAVSLETANMSFGAFLAKLGILSKGSQ